MGRFIFPLVLLVASIGLFAGFTNPLYKETKVTQTSVTELNQALSNAKSLQQERDILVEKYNIVTPEDRVKIETFLPSNVESIDIIQQVQDIGSEHNIVVKNVDFDPDQVKNPDEEGDDNARLGRTQRIQTEELAPYDTYDLEFSVQGSYAKFVSFLGSIEKSLRLIDVTEITFNSRAQAEDKGTYSDTYDYTFAIKVYRLK